MNKPTSGKERRRGVRIPISCEATIVPAGTISECEAICIDIGVGGMTLLTRYVPREEEIFEVFVKPPKGSVAGEIMHSRVQVRRCHASGDGQFSLGVKIIEVIK